MRTTPRVLSLLHHETATGISLFVATVLALWLGNSAWSIEYHAFLQYDIFIKDIKFSVEQAINDGLMTLFFLHVGLEIKKELLTGHLQTARQRALPAIAAMGGMMFPALIYLFINRHSPQNIHGWAIPTATDIAFAVGVISLLGRRVPLSVKVLLTAIAVFDDVGAIVIIALFYTGNIQPFFLLAAGFMCIVLGVCNLKKCRVLFVYVILGAGLWFCVLQSGVHATLAGVLLAFFIPLGALFEKAERVLYPLVSFFILPLFALANAGVSLAGMQGTHMLHPVPLGIAAGLFLGKQCGVMLFMWGAMRLNIAHMPERVRWGQLYGASLLTGIGFTMSLFIGNLSFTAWHDIHMVRMSILFGSALSAIAGYGVLYAVCKRTA